MEAGQSLNDIENMDILLYIRIMVYKMNKQEQEQTGYIDSVL